MRSTKTPLELLSNFLGKYADLQIVKLLPQSRRGNLRWPGGDWKGDSKGHLSICHMQGRHLHTCAPPPGAEAKPSIPHQRMNSRSVLQRPCLPPQKSCSHRLPSRRAHANSRHSEGGKKPEGSKMESDREVIHLQVSSVGSKGREARSQEKGTWAFSHLIGTPTPVLSRPYPVRSLNVPLAFAL